MPLDLQSYLLRVLEDGVVYRIGDHEGRRVDVRILSMTNRDLVGEVEAGRFRRDLYYRIAAARIRIPPLRERGDDVLLLAARFAAAAAGRVGRTVPVFSSDVLAALQNYPWPGNVVNCAMPLMPWSRSPSLIDSTSRICRRDPLSVAAGRSGL